MYGALTARAYTNDTVETSIMDVLYRRVMASGLIEKGQMLAVSESTASEVHSIGRASDVAGSRSNRRKIVGYTRANRTSPWRRLSLKLVPRDLLPMTLVQETGDEFLWRLLRSSAKRK